MSLYEVLNVQCKYEVDTDALITAAQQNPQDKDLLYSFLYPNEYGRFPLHQAIILGLSVEVIQALSSPIAIKAKLSDERTPLHLACEFGSSLDVVSTLLRIYPHAAREKDDDGDTPLHMVCAENTSLEVVYALLDVWPDAVREKDTYGYTPLHGACTANTSLEVVSALLDEWPDAVREKENEGWTPLHCACGIFGSDEESSLDEENRYVSLEVVSVLLDAWPDAVREMENNGYTPIHGAIMNNASLEVLQMLFDKWLEVTKNKSSHYMDSLIPYSSGNNKEFLHNLSSLFKGEQSNLSPNIVMTYFIGIKWWNGVWLVIKMYPFVIKKLHLHINTMADFLSIAGKRCSRTVMMRLLENEPDLLGGV
mmetsp:Transcript_2606/g.4090  ORF Transcript_2606/g.4090 Transcript_2606/m.4090 type:complete len:366 (+) Transcript_2606:102-1199(+)